MDSHVNSMSLVDTAMIMLDILLNVPAIYNHEAVLETLDLSQPKEHEKALHEWERLMQQDIITESNHNFSVNPSLVGEVKSAVEQYLLRKNISLESETTYLDSHLQENEAEFSTLASLTGMIYTSDGVDRVIFADNDWHSKLMPTCDELTRRGFAFRVSSSSKKHDYRTYYLRSWPFDSGKALRQSVREHLKANIEDMTDDEWKILFMLLLCQSARLKYSTIAANIHITDPHLRELVTSLQQRGFLGENTEHITLLKHLDGLLLEYFSANIYPAFKQRAVLQVKREIVKSISNLWLFSGTKRINELPAGEVGPAPVATKAVPKASIQEYEQQFHDMTRLGLIFDLDDRIVILSDVVKDIGNWLRSSIRESIIFIPRNDYYFARQVLQDILSKCKTYVKIQDPYLGVQTLHLLMSYIPEGTDVQLLGGLELGAREIETSSAKLSIVLDHAVPANLRFYLLVISTKRRKRLSTTDSSSPIAVAGPLEHH